ncbi:MAG: hypothetical protein U0168_13300 [Nannocystaceae bacterium]
MQNQECLLHPVKADKGVKVGGSFGAGLNLFLTDWVSLNLEIQDIVTATTSRASTPRSPTSRRS